MVDEVVWEQAFFECFEFPRQYYYTNAPYSLDGTVIKVQTGEAKKPSNKSEFFPKSGTSKKKSTFNLSAEKNLSY